MNVTFSHFKWIKRNRENMQVMYILIQGYTAKLKYDIHTKLPLELCQIQFWYDSSGNLV